MPANIPVSFFGWVEKLLNEYGELFLRGTGVTLLVALTGTVLGFVIIGLLSNSMNLLNINSFYQQIVKGCLIILAVLLDMLSKGRKD